MIDTEARLARIEHILSKLMWECAWDQANLDADIEHPRRAFASKVAEVARRAAHKATRKKRLAEIYEELFGEEAP